MVSVSIHGVFKIMLVVSSTKAMPESPSYWCLDEVPKHDQACLPGPSTQCALAGVILRERELAAMTSLPGMPHC